MKKILVTTLAACGLALAVPVMGAAPPENWDGLVKVKAKKLQLVYLRPGADFRVYTKVMLDPTEVSFRKNWQRDHSDISNRVDDSDVRRILDEAQKGFQKLFVEAYTKAGYQVVTTPGPDVLRLTTGIVNLDVNAPDAMTAGRVYTFSQDAGEATLVLQAYDSVSGSLLGRGIDRQTLDDLHTYIRNSVTNSSDFEQAFARWAKASAEGLTELKNISPVDTTGMQKK
ncbi:DUF3313 family protein [Sphingobium sp. AP49]|uniref:DUF3313 family protein n=1 Tax=Sphingobium sp. AP49 TaxID=1144307 RepID=UPI00026ED932|nr:DUF3313 family protein [Sphingobium sp. AP49]WHO38588.1 DUF3313 family protein [Sphingobium sp. AP49]